MEMQAQMAIRKGLALYDAQQAAYDAELADFADYMMAGFEANEVTGNAIDWAKLGVIAVAASPIILAIATLVL
jgi:hypothetical protein